MTTLIKNKIINELKDFPEDKINSLLDYMHFLKKGNKSLSNKKSKRINKETLRAINDIEQGKNLSHYDTLEDFFKEMKK